MEEIPQFPLLHVKRMPTLTTDISKSRYCFKVFFSYNVFDFGIRVMAKQKELGGVSSSLFWEQLCRIDMKCLGEFTTEIAGACSCLFWRYLLP